MQRAVGLIGLIVLFAACGDDGPAVGVDAGQSDGPSVSSDSSVSPDGMPRDGEPPEAGTDVDGSSARDATTGPDATPGQDAAGAPDGGSPDSGPAADVGTPSAACMPAASLVDTSSPDTTVGDGTAQSCTESELIAAISSGGVIVFDCGSQPVTIDLTQELYVTADTVIDGGGLVTLNGQDSTRILAIHGSFDQDFPALAVQRIGFVGGKSSGPTDDVDSGGGALFRRGGRFTIIDSQFSSNEAPLTGQDIAGGAVYGVGGGPTVISGSTFSQNRASSGGAIGSLHNDLVIVNSIVSGNTATGSGGNPGNGGNGGGIYIDGTSQNTRLSCVELRNNAANAFGGGLFRVSNDGTGTAQIDHSTVDGNQIPDQTPSKAGGLYLQGLTISIDATTISNNEAQSDGGLFMGPNTTFTMTNVTIAHNTALSSLGGGMSISSGVTGTILNVTFANNRAPGPVAFAAATVGGEQVTMKNTLVDGHEVGNGYNPISCRDQMLEGGGNFQYPVERSGAGSDDPSALCTSNTTVADVMLGMLQDNGGLTWTLVPASNGPAAQGGTGCPAEDQRGQPRSEPCTSGAVELP